MNDVHIMLMDKLEQNRLSLHNALQEYFADTSIPLQDRWNLFCKTPSYLKADHQRYMWYSVNDILGEDAVMYQGEAMSVDRYQTIYAIDLVDNYIDRYVGEPGVYEKSCELKEAVLKDNLYSFTYDW